MFQLRTRNLLLAALAVFLAVPALAQSQEGRVSGVVRDASGGAVGGATVTVVQQPAGVTSSVRSAADGAYAIAGLKPGLYTVSAELLGFRKAIQKDLSVAAGSAVKADFTLEALLAEEITVTAMKREETVANTPFAVTAPTEEVLRARGVEDIEGVARNVAGFSVQNLGPGQSQVAMRGVSSGQIARDQPGVKEQVGAYLDESVISLSLFTPDIDMFDLSRVEVLRGPQGTLFGSGSESGTVRYISNQPELGVKKGFAEFAGNTVSGGNQGGNVKLGFNAPLGDKAALRVAAYYTRFAGYIDTPGTQRTASGAIRPDTGTTKQDVNTGDRTGVRAAIKIAPNDRLTITPRIVYQKVETDGWNRIDAYNIMANAYTTTRPAVTLGEREQFTQIREPFTDKFFLGDLNIGYNFGDIALTSITSYTDRDIDVVRDATALTGGYTSLIWGVPEKVYTLDGPLDDATHAKVFTQEIRFSGGKDRFKWVAGGFYADTKRKYGQSLFVNGFTELTGIPSAGHFGAGNDVLFFSDLNYKLDQFAAFGEGTLSLTDAFSLTGGLRYYHFKEERTQVFDGLFADPASKPGTIKADGVAPRLIASYKVSGNTNLNAQVSKGFRLGGINDQLNKPLCSPADLETFGGRDTWKDETAWNYEIGSKSRIMGHRGSFNVSAFYMDVKDLQATLTAGTCSSRVIFSVPKARSAGAEVEFAIAPNEHFDFALSANYNDAKLKSTVTSTASDGKVSVVGGIKDGNRLPSVPEFQMSAAATYQWHMSGSSLGYATGTYQHVGSRFTQVQDQAPGFGVVAVGFGGIGAPYTQATFRFDPELPAYDIVNLRLGVLKGKWDVALFGNNLTDERALLALDREAGKNARLGYLTNQPRTFGIATRFKF